MNGGKALKLVVAVFLLVLGTYYFFHSGLYVYFTNKERAIQLIRSHHPFDEVIFISLQIFQVVFAPIPGEATGLIGGYLFGTVLGTIYSTIGLTIGSWLAFVLARFFGLPFVEKTVKPETLKKYDYTLEHQGALVSLVLFLIPGFPKDYLCYLMGLSHMSTGTFLIVSTIGRLFGTLLLSICGSYARNSQYRALVIILGVSGFCALIAYLYRDKWIEMLRRKPKVET
jgi:uncharacterized membrane protein YdjX (TVP38/TMEM64 family)